MPETVIHDWEIFRESAADDFSQSLFFLGNGYIGMRGFSLQSPKRHPWEHGVFRAGLYDPVRPGITDLVQLPDAFGLAAEGEGRDTVLQALDMRRGVLTHRWETERLFVECARMVSMADKQLVCVRLTLTVKAEGEYTVAARADARVRNLPVHDDQTVKEKETVRLLTRRDLREGEMRFVTRRGGQNVRFSWDILSSHPAQRRAELSPSAAITRLTCRLAKGETWTVEKRVRLQCMGEAENPACADPWADHEAAWAALWEDCDLVLDAQDGWQGAVRYNIFQLLCNNAAGSREVSIGARGLTHGRYKGNTFWDTEIFMLPFFLWTRPAAARNLLLYRADRLGDARDLARRQTLKGARFPWMCAVTGREQCESWDIGLCETHVTADVAYAMDRYAQVTGDEAFLRETAAEVFAETARYWQSRFTFEPQTNRYSLFFVKGPDEYCGAAVNNTYTNYMARHNVRLALRHGSLAPREREELANFAERIALLYDPARDLYLQDETLERLEEMPFIPGNGAPMYRQISFDRLQRYRVLKQADLVLLMTLFPEDFTSAQKYNVFACYEPITLHDSTLSYGVHAQLALALNLWDKAEEYLQKAVFLDLHDVLCNTGGEGIHMAALGAAWQALVFGAAGVALDGDGAVKARPHLPPGIKAMRFTVQARGKRYRVSVAAPGEAQVQLIP